MKSLNRSAATGALALVLLAASVPALSATTTVFEPSMQVQGAPLVLNGAGTRYKVIFKVYDMGLYLPRKASTYEEMVAMPGPKRINFVAQRDIPGTELGLAFIKGLTSNSSADLVQKHTASSTRLIEIFSGRSKLAQGDAFAMEYQPGKGTSFFIAGQPQGAPLGDAEFFNMVLKIWLGPVPADFKLKDALLGQHPG